MVILSVFGSINKWGASVIRPIICQMLNFILFASIYQWRSVQWEVADPFKKSFDIMIIAGYTNHSSEGVVQQLWVAQSIQLLISVVFYTIIFSTIVARGSRARS